MEREYYDLNKDQFEVIDTNLPVGEEKDYDSNSVELDDIEHTLRNINLSYLNDENMLVENSNQEIVAPSLEEQKPLFESPVNFENKISEEPINNTEPVIETSNFFKEANLFENRVTEKDIIDDILKNKEIIINAINKVNENVIDSSYKTGVADSEYLRNAFAKTPVFNNVKEELDLLINNFALKASQNINQYEETDKLSAFRI